MTIERSPASRNRQQRRQRLAQAKLNARAKRLAGEVRVTKSDDPETEVRRKLYGEDHPP